MRGGTENIPAVVGLSMAFDLLRENIDNDILHYKTLRDYLIKKLKDVYGEYVLFNSGENGLYNIVNISFDTDKLIAEGDMLLIQLDLKGIAESGGSACSSGAMKPSRVLLESGRDEKTAMASLRISFGRKNKIEEIDYFMEVLKELVRKK
jgi:cysteine desulfurase